MKLLSRAAAVVACLALGACWTSGDDQAAQNVEQGFENVADQLENAAENASGEEAERLEKTADVMEDTGEAASDSIDDNDLPAQNKQ